MQARDVIVVGGGVIGCAAAYFLAREGLSVCLYERDDLARHASGAAAGMIAPICESTGEGPFFELACRSFSMFPDLTARLREQSGVDPQYVHSGILRIAGRADEADHLRAQVRRLAVHGLEWLSPEAAREREPGLTPDLCGALWSPREGHVFSPLLTRSYALAAARHGAGIEIGNPVIGLKRQGSRVVGVETEGGPRPAGHVVLCAGVWTRFCAEWLDLRLPLEPVRGQILALDSPCPPLSSIVWGAEAYLVPKLNGSVVVGATEEHAGFDCRATAAGIGGLLTAAPRLVPALAGCSFRQAWAGLRPDTPDHLPVIGPVPGVDGLTVAAGHFRNGVLLSPITALLVADGIIRSDWPLSAQPFAPERFLSERVLSHHCADPCEDSVKPAQDAAPVGSND